jgi:hypothetical protein
MDFLISKNFGIDNIIIKKMEIYNNYHNTKMDLPLIPKKEKKI